MDETNYWWWYIHENGSIQVKRYFWKESNIDIQDARESPFVWTVFTQFPAENREQAIIYISKLK